MNKLELTVELIEKFNKPVPRYTSYPTVPYWTTSFGPNKYLKTIEKASESLGPLSLYIHVPFCERRCLFCGCNTYITRRRDRSVEYLKTLFKEIRTIAKLLKDRTSYSQFHIGGGTPTHLSPDQLQSLLSFIDERFEPVKDVEKSIEIHPSVTTKEHIDVLIENGFNRLSLGVQDFDPIVQARINRFQTFEETRDLVEYAREQGVISTNFDLIYGLPYQTPDGFAKTLEQVKSIKPERLAVYSYAHLPQVFRHQSQFPPESIPKGREKLALFLLARRKLLDHGYRQIGFDHFALPNDELWKAYQESTLQRNFMGYTTKAGTDLVAFGYSGISDVQSTYAQNSKILGEYHQLVEKFGVATIRGIQLSGEDVARKDTIMTWLCQFQFERKELLAKHGEEGQRVIEDAEHFFPRFEELGLVRRTRNGWVATDLGRIFARIVAAALDSYLNKKKVDITFSQSI